MPGLCIPGCQSEANPSCARSGCARDFVNTPLSDRDKDAFATQAVEAADLQGKFWEMHDLLFEKQAEWSALTPAAFESWAVQQAAGLGMDPVQFQLDFKGKTVADRLQRSIRSTNGQSISPPMLFVNSNSRYTGLADFASLDTVVRMEALSARQFTSCPAWVIDPLKQYIATLHTSKGDVVIQLFPDKAPLAVNNFVSLARNGWFDGITFYKMLPDFLVMTGDPSETGYGQSRLPLQDRNLHKLCTSINLAWLPWITAGLTRMAAAS